MSITRRNPYGCLEFQDNEFAKWEEETHIPKDVWEIISTVAEKIGIGHIYEETIELRNRGGYIYAYAKGISLVHCTSSMADGPSPDYSKTFMKWVQGLGMRIENSYGDNGMDSATNWRDTYWTHEIICEETITDAETFEKFVPNDETDEEAESAFWEYEREREEEEYMGCGYYDEF